MLALLSPLYNFEGVQEDQQPANLQPVADWFLPPEVTRLVLAHLDARSLVMLQAVERRMRTAVVSCASWGAHCERDFGRSCDSSPADICYRDYLRMWLERCDDEISHLRASSRIAKGMSTYVKQHNEKHSNKGTYWTSISLPGGDAATNAATNAAPGHGIIGMVCDICAFSRRDVAHAVAYKRQSALNTVLTTRSAAVVMFRKAGTIRGPMTFLPLSTITNAHQQVNLKPPSIPPPIPSTSSTSTTTSIPDGFIGLAVELVLLRKEHEHLRHTVLTSNIFKDLQVWESEAAVHLFKLRAIRRHWEREAARREQPRDGVSEEEASAADDQSAAERAAIENLNYVALDTYAQAPREDVEDALEDSAGDRPSLPPARMLLMRQVPAHEAPGFTHRDMCHLVDHGGTLARALAQKDRAQSALAFAEYGM